MSALAAHNSKSSSFRFARDGVAITGGSGSEIR
jgi:hypothetical protein